MVAPDCSCLPLDSSSTVVSWSDVQAVPDCSWLLLASLGSCLAATGCSWLLLACPQLLLPVCSSKFRLLASPGCCSPGLHSRILAPNSSLHNYCSYSCRSYYSAYSYSSARFYSLSFLLLLNLNTSEKTLYVFMCQSSESPPGGNQVDGLPPALSLASWGQTGQDSTPTN